MVVPLRPDLPEGWYLIYWRAISVDGHPVNGFFTYAVGPNPGPAPQFRIPNISATATTPQLLITRWAMFVFVMAAIGLFVMRLLDRATGDPECRRRRACKPLSVAFGVSAALGLIAIPVYLDVSTANDSLRSVFDVTALVPLFRVTAFGRAMVDLEVCFALFCLAAAGRAVGRPSGADAPIGRRTDRVVRGAARGGRGADRPGRRRPRGTDLAPRADAAVRLAAPAVRARCGSADWSGCSCCGGRVSSRERVPALSVVVPRFSNVALVSVLVLAATGVGEAIEHIPAINALWETSYGQAILVKTGLLGGAMLIASGNLLRSRPRLIAAQRSPELGEPAARLLRGLISGEVVVVIGIVFAAAVLSSLAPPPPAFALENSALASVGPGRVVQTINHAGYKLQVLVSPNKAAAPDSFALRITKAGQPVRGANVTLLFNHLEMQMPTQEYQLTEIAPGVYSRAAPALVMVGRWGLTFQVTPQHGVPFTALIVDQANG